MSGLDNMKRRMEYDGGKTSDERNVKGKLLSFRSALDNSYQAENITFQENRYRCLINPDKLKEDYDQKEISIDYSAGMKSGSVFYWDRTKTHWICYLQRYEEEAYFRAQIRKCDYSIDINGKPYWVYMRGPVETALIWRQKHQIEFNELNYSLIFYITKNDETMAFFHRLNTIKFDGHTWRVAAVDRYSQEGLIEVYLDEYFDNEMEDKQIEEVEFIPDPTQPYIDGPRKVSPYDTKLSYSIVNSSEGVFVVNSTKVKITSSTSSSCELEILTGKSTNFNLIYKVEGKKDVVLPIKVESL